MENVFLTGCSGYIGTNIIDHFSGLNIVIDGLCRHKNCNFKLRNHYSYDLNTISGTNVKFEEYDTVILNAGIGYGQNLQLIDFVKANYSGNLKILNILENLNTNPKIIYHSTAGIDRYIEAYEKLSNYLLSKIMFEIVVMEELPDLDITILRLNNIYSESCNLFPFKFLRNYHKTGIKQKNITINYTDEYTIRNYVHIKELTRLIKEFPFGKKGIYSILSNETYSLLQIMNLISEITDNEEILNQIEISNQTFTTDTFLSDSIIKSEKFKITNQVTFREELETTFDRGNQN